MSKSNYPPKACSSIREYYEHCYELSELDKNYDMMHFYQQLITKTNEQGQTASGR
jgi:hypothetical protein